jgi:hypothetical protein
MGRIQCLSPKPAGTDKCLGTQPTIESLTMAQNYLAIVANKLIDRVDALEKEVKELREDLDESNSISA